MGQPEDLMGAVTFLLSDAAGYITCMEGARAPVIFA